MAFIPGGFESEDDYDSDDGFMFSDEIEKPRRLTVWDFMKQDRKLDVVEIDWGAAVVVSEPRKGIVNLDTTADGTKSDLIQCQDDKSDLKSDLKTSPCLCLDTIRVAAMNGNLDYVRKYLPIVGVDIRLKNEWTCLMWATAHARPEIVRFCLESGADANQHKSNMTVLMVACVAQIDTSDNVKKLCYSPLSDPDFATSTDGAGDTNPTIVITQDREADIGTCVDLLVGHGAEVNQIDPSGTTPLIFAVKKNRRLLVDKLLTLGANINHADTYGYSAIHIASLFGLGAMIDLLIKKGAKFDAKTDDGDTIANIAFQRDHQKLGFILEEILASGRVSDEVSEQLQSIKPFGNPWSMRNTDMEDCGKNETTKEGADIEKRLYEVHLSEFLHSVNLSHLEALFRSRRINFLDLLSFQDATYEELGIKLSERKKIASGIRRFHLASWSRQALPSLRGQKIIDQIDVLSFLAHVNSQLHYARASLDFLKREIEKETSDQLIETLASEIDGCLDQVDRTHIAISELDSTIKDIDANFDIGEINEITPDLIQDIMGKVSKVQKQVNTFDAYGNWKEEDDTRGRWFPKILLSVAIVSIGSIIALKILRKSM